MDYGKYIRMMPIILNGTIKVYRLNEEGHEILLYYLSSSESCSMAYSCCIGAKKSEVKAIAEHDEELIADELATSRVVISRLLKQLENDKKIILYRNEIKLLNELNLIK